MNAQYVIVLKTGHDKAKKIRNKRNLLKIKQKIIVNITELFNEK